MGEKIPHWLDKQAFLNPEKTALETPEGHVWTFSELQERSRQMAYDLKRMGVEEGDHIAFLSGNDIHFPVFIHAVSYIGAVVVLLNTRLTAPEISYQLQDADVSRLFFAASLTEKAYQAVEGTGVKAVECINEPSVSREEGGLKKEIDFDAPYTMMYTSGTTGNPKAVIHTYGNHWYSAAASALNLGLTPDDKWLICLPLFHVGGFSVLIKSVVYGMSVYLMDKFNQEQVHEAVMDKHVTHASVVTVMLQHLVKRAGSSGYPDTFRCMLLGGGPVPNVLLKNCSQKGIPVFQTYGMTETSSQIATLSPASAFDKAGSAGKALSLAQLWIDTPVPGEIGEIIVQGPMVSKGYYNRPARQESYIHTGDLGYQDEDGFLYVVDRVKDMIISGGENVYPAEIESVLSEIPGVKEAGVTGRPDDRWGEVPAAFLVAENETIRNADIYRYIGDRLAKYKQPADIYWVQELPRNASNKLLRRKLFSLTEGGDQ
ncbi:o-succinylbenzoate--CoA ligase [Halobacillus kuroshimensis]|uniref:2-succinylbenzoate--CoA ligase n=1 Tax=Halobacillus kuroshimensis TaxID=302481 RepID=A0ABS3DW53_9BACI|nr:o-succinylbenzoate--CoA ligase [Halobacillus kuroshimensis]MBN8235559.1 o-succinylbenzoate--CoA ligase [Halobacillus kuroshimensis]